MGLRCGQGLPERRLNLPTEQHDMNRFQARAFLPILKAFIEKRPVEVCVDGEWKEVSDMIFSDYQYRVKRNLDPQIYSLEELKEAASQGMSVVCPGRERQFPPRSAAFVLNYNGGLLLSAFASGLFVNLPIETSKP